MGNREVNYTDILHKNSHPHICLCHAIHMSNLTLTSTTTPQGTILIQVTQASSAHLTNIFEMVNHPVINILMVPENKIQKHHYWLIFKLPRWHVGKIQCNDLVFFFIMTHERMHERHFAQESVTWLDVVALNAV